MNRYSVKFTENGKRKHWLISAHSATDAKAKYSSKAKEKGIKGRDVEIKLIPEKVGGRTAKQRRERKARNTVQGYYPNPKKSVSRYIVMAQNVKGDKGYFDGKNFDTDKSVAHDFNTYENAFNAVKKLQSKVLNRGYLLTVIATKK